MTDDRKLGKTARSINYTHLLVLRVPPKVKKIVFGPKSEWPKNAMGRRINVSRKATNALEAACKKRGIELFADW